MHGIEALSFALFHSTLQATEGEQEKEEGLTNPARVSTECNSCGGGGGGGGDDDDDDDRTRCLLAWFVMGGLAIDMVKSRVSRLDEIRGGPITLGSNTLSSITLGPGALGSITLDLVTLGSITLGSITLGLVTLGSITLGPITLRPITLH